MSVMSDWFDVGNADDFGDGEVAPVVAGGQPVAVFRLGEELFALKDLCTHGNAKLSDGYVEDGCVECPLHQGLFDIRGGAPRCAPVTEAVRSFPVRVVAGRVEVGMGTAAQEDAAPAVQKMQATIHGITRAALDVAVLQLRCDGAELTYQAGQYIDVLLGDGQRRSYSMATHATGGQDVLELHVRHLPGGLFTDRVFGGTPAVVRLCAGAVRGGQRIRLDGAHRLRPSGSHARHPRYAAIPGIRLRCTGRGRIRATRFHRQLRVA